MDSIKLREFRDRLTTLYTLSDYLGEISSLTAELGCRSNALVMYLKQMTPGETEPSRFVFSTSTNLDWIAEILSLSASCWTELVAGQLAGVKLTAAFSSDRTSILMRMAHADSQGFSLLCFERVLNGDSCSEVSVQLSDSLLAYGMQFSSSLLTDQADYFYANGQPALSQRERELLRLLSQGYTRKEISILRHKAIGTVDKQLGAILRKLGARNATHAVALAAKWKLIVLSEGRDG